MSTIQQSIVPRLGCTWTLSSSGQRGHSDALSKYLAAMAKFRAYSFLNVLLILKACPNANHVAGYKTWQSLGRQVRQGEKGIMILAPIFRKRTENASEATTKDDGRLVAGYRAVYVWDRLSRDLWPGLCALDVIRE